MDARLAHDLVTAGRLVAASVDFVGLTASVTQ
jgi:hypothetical protein